MGIFITFSLFTNLQLHFYVWASPVAQLVKCLPAMRETRVRSLVGKIPWRRKWQSTPVLLPGKFHGLRNLVGYSPWGCKESDTTVQLHFMFNSDLFEIDFEFWSEIVLFHMFFGVGVIFLFPQYSDLVPDCQSILGKSWKIEQFCQISCLGLDSQLYCGCWCHLVLETGKGICGMLCNPPYSVGQRSLVSCAYLLHTKK